MDRGRDDREEGKCGKYSRSLQHDTAHTGHGAQAVCGVLDGQGLILKDGGKEKERSVQGKRPL